MRKLVALCLVSALFAAGVSAAVRPRRDLVGLRLGMTKEAARRHLQKIGNLQREERKRQEVWEVRDAYFSHIIVGFDDEAHVRFITAVAREGGGRRMRYSAVASLKRARQEGDVSINNYNYVWDLAARGKEPQGIVVARGRDPQYLSTYTLKMVE